MGMVGKTAWLDVNNEYLCGEMYLSEVNTDLRVL